MISRSSINKKSWYDARVRNVMVISFIAVGLWVGSLSTVKAQVDSPMTGRPEANGPTITQAGDNLSTRDLSDPVGGDDPLMRCGNSGRPGCPPKKCSPNGNPGGVNPNPGNPNCRQRESHKER